MWRCFCIPNPYSKLRSDSIYRNVVGRFSHFGIIDNELRSSSPYLGRTGRHAQCVVTIPQRELRLFSNDVNNSI